jgi:glucan-binding YG repeat protein
MKIDVKFEDEEQKDKKQQSPRPKYFKRVDPTKDLIIKTLIICAIIDIPLGSYFYYKKTHEPPPAKKQKIIRKITKIERQIVQPELMSPPQLVQPYQRRYNPIPQRTYRAEPQRKKMYIWINEKGHKVYSNKGCPKGINPPQCVIEYY